jgi:tetratricopeptide (TPR) repeat protein
MTTSDTIRGHGPPGACPHHPPRAFGARVRQTRIELGMSLRDAGPRLLFGRLLADQGGLDEAARNLDEAERLLASAPAVELTVLSLDRAGIALARGDYADAEGHVRRALELLEGTATPRYADRVWETLAEVEERAGDLEAALAALRARSTSAPTR